MTRSSVLLLVSLFGLFACATGESVRKESGRKQYLEFAAFTVEEGVYKSKPGWKFTEGKKKGTIVAARMTGGPGIVITPCECALETGGSCDQATISGPDGDITEIWCEDNKCGFCVGGTAEPDDPTSAVRFNVVCIEGRKASR